MYSNMSNGGARTNALNVVLWGRSRDGSTHTLLHQESDSAKTTSIRAEAGIVASHTTSIPMLANISTTWHGLRHDRAQSFASTSLSNSAVSSHGACDALYLFLRIWNQSESSRDITSHPGYGCSPAKLMCIGHFSACVSWRLHVHAARLLFFMSCRNLCSRAVASLWQPIHSDKSCYCISNCETTQLEHQKCRAHATTKRHRDTNESEYRTLLQ